MFEDFEGIPIRFKRFIRPIVAAFEEMTALAEAKTGNPRGPLVS